MSGNFRMTGGAEVVDEMRGKGVVRGRGVVEVILRALVVNEGSKEVEIGRDVVGEVERAGSSVEKSEREELKSVELKMGSLVGELKKFNTKLVV